MGLMGLPDDLRKWRGKNPRKAAAYDLGIPISTFRKYESGDRTPTSLSLAELKRRMNAIKS